MFDAYLFEKTLAPRRGYLKKARVYLKKAFASYHIISNFMESAKCGNYFFP
jgi:hypothetical protein